jgi:RNA recognition motif-containing protein
MVTRTKKIFVGGLSAPTTLEDVKSYFEQFGTVSTANKKKSTFSSFKIDFQLLRANERPWGARASAISKTIIDTSKFKSQQRNVQKSAN